MTVYRLKPGTFPRRGIRQPNRKLFTEQFNARRIFERYMEIMINKSLTLKNSSSSGIVAIIDFSTPNKLILDAFSLGNGREKITSNDNNALTAQRRIWSKYVIEYEDGIPQRRLQIEQNKRQNYTVFKENHQHHQEIIIDTPSPDYIDWMYQYNPLIR